MNPASPCCSPLLISSLFVRFKSIPPCSLVLSLAPSALLLAQQQHELSSLPPPLVSAPSSLSALCRARPLASNPVRSTLLSSTRSLCSRTVTDTLSFLPAAPLSAKLTEEINFEAENAESETEQPEFLTNFLSEGVWAVSPVLLDLQSMLADLLHLIQVEDKPGNDEVILTRSFGNESHVSFYLPFPSSSLSNPRSSYNSIRLIFSISDLDAEAEADEYLEPEEGADAGSGGVGDEALGGPSDESFPVETSITITKAGGGALSIDAVAQGALGDFREEECVGVEAGCEGRGAVQYRGKLTMS